MLAALWIFRLSSMFFQVFLVIFSLITMIVVFPWFAIMIAVLAVLFGFIYVYFRSAVRELKRMDNITRSVIMFRMLCRINQPGWSSEN